MVQNPEMIAVSLAETSELSLFAKVDIYWYPENDLYFLNVTALRFTGRNVFFIWYGFCLQYLEQ